jgi:FkbM family methyltransferase
MQSLLCREVSRRTPFRLENLPWIAKVYSYPFERWSTLGRQALFGAPHFFLFLLYQKFWPFQSYGTFKASIKGQDKTIRFNVRNTQFHALYFSAFDAGYEPQATALMDLLASTDGVFYDIGSNWGWFSLTIASRSDFKGKVHAFEPFPSTYLDLANVINQAGIDDQVKCHNVALSDKSGQTFMRLPDHFQSGLASVDENASNGAKTVQTATLDSLAFDPPTLMKVDVESAEIKVFRGGAGFLAKHKPMILFENSRHPDNPSQTLDPILFLKELGYVFYQLAWLRQDQGRTFFVGDDADPAPQPKETLALIPFQAGERLLFHDGFNAFACHSEKVPELEALFEKRTL